MKRKTKTKVGRAKQRAREARNVQRVINLIEVEQSGATPSRTQAERMGEDEITSKLRGALPDRSGWALICGDCYVPFMAWAREKGLA